MCWLQLQGLRLKGEGGALPLHEDQLGPRPVAGLPQGAVKGLACAHFHTSVLLEGADGGGDEPARLFTFGTAAGSRLQHHEPCPLPLPRLVAPSSLTLSSASTRTVITVSDSGTFSTDFSGPTGAAEWTQEGTGLEAREAEGSSRVVGFMSGLVHRLYLLERSE